MVLPPNPPPISAGVTRISPTGMPSSFAVSARITKCPWLEAQISGRPVGVESRDASMRLDIGLVHRRRLELLVDDLVGFGKACGRVTDLELDPLRDIGGPCRRRLDAASDHVLEEERRIRLHRFVY